MPWFCSANTLGSPSQRAKILASRPRDLGDIEGILATNPKLDRRRVRRLVRQFSEVLEMPELNERLAELFSGRRRR